MTCTLAELVAALPRASLKPGGAAAAPAPAGVEVRDATHDSRQVQPGWLFCAVVGERRDGHDHLGEAVDAGAAAVLVERDVAAAVPRVVVPDARAATGPAAAAIHGHPSRRFQVVGITGTNGKTTITYLVEAAAAADGRGTGLIGTVETRIHGAAQPGVRTTPEGTDLQRLLRRMVDRGVDVVATEVSSHGLALRRVDGTRFAVAVFTNLSQDHLDFHGSMGAYEAAKARLFTAEMADRAVVCVDDEAGRRIAARTQLPVTTYGLHEGADHRLRDVDVGAAGSRARLEGPGGRRELSTRLPGRFNLVNAAGAFLAAVGAGVDPDAAAAGIAACPGVPGRLERVTPADVAGPTVLVDYAHTPEAIEAALDAVRELAAGRVIIVVGAGGDRDPGKRDAMGAAAAAADVAVLTSDNPRSESPEQILDAVVAGAEGAIAAGAPAEVVVEADRRVAIAAALDRAAPDDVVLIAGKGHETGQEIQGELLPFDDRAVATELLGAGP